MGLQKYHRKRDFKNTPEPKGRIERRTKQRFVVQEHHASRLHFDFRLEIGGVLKSWSVPKGPTLDPKVKRLAVMTEDHPVEYLKFEGRIPKNHYGAGEQLIWDQGQYVPMGKDDPSQQLMEGKLSFELRGEKLQGEFHLIRMKEQDRQWLLIKSDDQYAKSDWKLVLRLKKDTAAPKKAKPGAARRSTRALSAKNDRAKSKPDAEPVDADVALSNRKVTGDLKVRVGKDTVSLTNLQKVYWPKDGYTKGDLLGYYLAISKYLLPHLKDRPLILKRYPNGISQASFHQHDVNDTPDFARTVSIVVEQGHTNDYLVCNNLATLLYTTNLGAIEQHAWHSRVRNLDHPDWCVFDLDPGKDVEFPAVCEVAIRLKEILARFKLESFAKTSGSRGIHIYVPLKPTHSYQAVARFAARIASIAAEENDLATVERALKSRPRGSVYVDHLQNARGKSIAAPYSVRPKEGAPVSAPLTWNEVKRGKLALTDFTIESILSRVAGKGDLFAPTLTLKQTLARL